MGIVRSPYLKLFPILSNCESPTKTESSLPYKKSTEKGDEIKKYDCFEEIEMYGFSPAIGIFKPVIFCT
ncbi:hypothetical protein ACFPA1_03180 [Neobacillus sp. GCM10023253]|uniref:hypothetical protein n=1 Tax=Neobacillus sp. GCM10023253 TaxID=3252644 RepID=UPI00360D97F2